RRRCARAVGVWHLTGPESNIANGGNVGNLRHVPVLTAEALDYLRPGRGGLFVDCMVGLGGHARALLEAGATRVIGLDRDRDALEQARDTLAPWSDRVEL